jgi:2-keto-3-deoxy-6-phosphogluconate aldolase
MKKVLATPRSITTGGITIENLSSDVQGKIILAAAGTWLAKKDDISEGNWKEITNCCKEVLSQVS